MNRILAIGCALAVIAAPAATFAAPLSAPQVPATPSTLELVAAMTMTVTTAGTQVKEQPISSSRTLSVLNAGDTVDVLDRTANGLWARVQMGSTTGYVRVDALK
jgi:uncharacterized protein YgiM (DUF1202 family)